MRKNRMYFRNKVWTAALLMILPWLGTGCSGDSSHPSKKGPGQADHDHNLEGKHNEGHEDHGHGEGSWEALSLSMDQIADETCEHNVPTYECDECRYEVGVVRVPESLVKNADGDGPGLVRMQTVTRRKFSHGLTVTGEVQWNGNAVVHISPRIPGIIQSVRVDLGTRVRQGDLLFIMDSVALGRALSEYERSRALTSLSRKNMERETSLYKRRISSEQDMIEAQMIYEQHNTERKAAEQALRVLGLTEEEVASVRETPQGVGTGRLPVRAPRDGTIVEKHAVVGERVEPGSDVMFLADLTTLWVWADIYERDLPRLIEAGKKGSIPAEVFVRAFPERPFQASIDYVGALMDPRTRTVKVRATVENPDQLLRPGMFCEIRMGISGLEEVLAVPRNALLSNEGLDFVFTHWKQDYFLGRPVKTGRGFLDQVEILEGLTPGERIVTEGAFLLKSDILREKMGAGCAD